jgi:hypothetical protein
LAWAVYSLIITKFAVMAAASPIAPTDRINHPRFLISWTRRPRDASSEAASPCPYRRKLESTSVTLEFSLVKVDCLIHFGEVQLPEGKWRPESFGYNKDFT